MGEPNPQGFVLGAVLICPMIFYRLEVQEEQHHSYKHHFAVSNGLKQVTLHYQVMFTNISNNFTLYLCFEDRTRSLDPPTAYLGEKDILFIF